MKRFLLGAVLLLLALPTCATHERPEGIVERWLLALNQGAAGEPDRYAPSGPSNEVLSNWHEREPGQLDVMEVGRAAPIEHLRPQEAYSVPIRIVRIDGSALEGFAIVIASREGLLVASLNAPERTGGSLPSDGGPRFGATSLTTWIVAIAAGFALLAVSETAMKLVRRRPP